MTTLPIASTPVLSACCQDGADGTGQLSHKTLRTLGVDPLVRDFADAGAP